MSSPAGPILVLLASGLVGLAACGDGPSPDAASDRWRGSVDTIAADEVDVRNTGGGAWLRDTVMAERTLLLGEIGISEGTEATTFGDISGLAVDREGRLYVADRMTSTVRAYSAAGEPLTLIGSEGEGPGEFQSPMALAAGPEGTLVVADLDGLTLKAPPAPGDLATEPAGTWSYPGYVQIYRPLGVNCQGTVYYPDQRSPSGVSTIRHFYLLVDFGEGVRDTLRVPKLEGLPGGTPFVRTGPGGGRMVPGIDRPPLSPVPSWDMTPGGKLLLGEARAYRLALLSPTGDTVRTIGRAMERRAIPREIRRESAAALQARLDTLPGPISDIENLPPDVAEVQLPERYPAHRDVRVASDGRIWVERQPLEDRPETTPYDVFDATGVYLGTVVLPVRFTEGRGYTHTRVTARPQFTADRAYGVVVDTATGVQRIAGFSFEPPDREEAAPRPPPPPCSGSSGSES